VKLSRQLSDEESARLFDAARSTLVEWIERLRREAGGEFPEGVTAFRHDMAVHGRYGRPCPTCGLPVQRVVYAANETNYCARCQTGGKLLADRALSRLLREDWPRTVEALEERRRGASLASEMADESSAHRRGVQRGLAPPTSSSASSWRRTSAMNPPG
jgi:formamidopyrimidine-DNA glycosylase